MMQGEPIETPNHSTAPDPKPESATAIPWRASASQWSLASQMKN
jgi:hypothetical protein